MSEFWDRLRGSPRGQIPAVLVLVVVALAIGTLLEPKPSETLLSEIVLLAGDGTKRRNPCPDRLGSAERMVCVSTVNLNSAKNDETRSSEHEFRAIAYHSLHQDGRALRDLDAAIALGNVSRWTRASSLLYRGAIKLQSHDAAGADTDFTQALPLMTDDDRWSAIYNRGLARIELGKTNLALADFNSAIASLLKLRSRLKAATPGYTREFPIAERHKLRASWDADIARTIAAAYGSRAMAYRVLGHYKNSLEDYNAGLKLSPDSPSLYSGRARTEFAMGDWRGGFRDYWIRTRIVLHWN